MLYIVLKACVELKPVLKKYKRSLQGVFKRLDEGENFHPLHGDCYIKEFWSFSKTVSLKKKHYALYTDMITIFLLNKGI